MIGGGRGGTSSSSGKRSCEGQALQFIVTVHLNLSAVLGPFL